MAGYLAMEEQGMEEVTKTLLLRFKYKHS